MLANRQDGTEAPEFLTVAEAAALLRVGRTKAYAMTQEWRASGGRRGLPVVDFGDLLRVPVRALEQLVDDALRPEPEATGPLEHDATVTEPTPLPTEKPGRVRRHRAQPADQAALFDLPPAS